MELSRAISANQNYVPTSTELVDMYGDIVYKFCRSLAFSKEEADDLFQETYLKAIENTHKIKFSPQGFLLSTALYIWKSWKRKHARRNKVAPATHFDDALAVVSDTDVEGEFSRQEELDFVRDVVDALPEKYRVPIILYYNVELDLAEISQALDIPAGTVKSRLHKARKLVEKGLVKNGYR